MEESKRYRVVVVEDERLARKDLIDILSGFDCIEVTGEAADVTEAVECIRSLMPDIVFLDIQMPGESGFDLLEKINFPGHVVFVTAFDEYAIRAFEVNALDYLLKPVSRQRMQLTIDRISSGGEPEKVKKELKYEDRLFMMVGHQMRFVKMADIICIQAVGDYSKVTLKGSNAGLVLKTMAEWEKRLPPGFFIRVHKSAIINMEFVERVDQWMNYTYRICLKDMKEPMIMSRRYARQVKDKLG